MKIAILGFGAQGRSAYEYWNTPDNQLTICDTNTDLEAPGEASTKLGPNYLNDLGQFDMLIRTPILHPRDITSANPESPDILAKVWSNTNEFMKVCPTRNIIGVTGTKGKGTTSTLITKMLEAAGKTVHLGGNIGIPPLEMLHSDIQPDDWVVLELANFQLIDLQISPHIAVCLMVEPEHMDWHADFKEYKAAKKQLFAHQSTKDTAIFYADNETSREIASQSQSMLIPYFAKPGAVVEDETIKIDGNEICSVHELKLLGKHNWQNVCAAVTAFWQISQDTQAIRWTIDTFSGLEHRLEHVSTIEKVDYYDDSFGTTPETAVVAIEAFEQPKIVILGGSDKHASYDKLARTVVNHNVRSVIVIGDTASEISTALKNEGFSSIESGPQTMPEIVALARSLAQPGDVVLLSTGCASFGLFKNYKDRGDQFTQAVRSLSQADAR